MSGLTLTLFFLSLFGGFLSGLLGVGGAVVMIPLMLFVPPLVGVGSLDMKQVAGISMLQVLASSISGLVIHRGHGQVHSRALFWAGIPMALAALLGGWGSKYVPSHIILLLFALLMLAALILLAGFRRPEPEPGQPSDSIPIQPWAAVAIGVGVGVASGMAGAGGGFLMVPLLLVVLRLPLKITIGTSLGIVFFGSLAGAVGKIAGGQVEWAFLWPVLAGSIPAARLGARVSRVLPSRVLHALLLVTVGLSLLQAVGKYVEVRQVYHESETGRSDIID